MIFKFLVRWTDVIFLSIGLGFVLVSAFAIGFAIMAAISKFPMIAIGIIAFLCITASIATFTLLKK